MKLVVLTSNILDGLIVCQKLVDEKRDVKAIVYEKKNVTLKSFLKRVLYMAKGIIRHSFYAGFKKDIPGLIAEGVDNINSEHTRSILKDAAADLIIVVGTRKLPKDIFSAAKHGSINLHAGVLPFYRGADSEFWALYNGEPDKIGVSIIFVEEGLDEGDVILWSPQKVSSTDDHKTLRMKNLILGAEKMNEAVGLIESNNYSRVKQDEALARTYKSATKEDIKEYQKMKRSGLKEKGNVLKEFDSGEIKAKETVARTPSILKGYRPISKEPRFFCLRIDADEYDKETFRAYYPLFEKYSDAITVFFSVNSFKNAGEEILKCKEMGVDVQSHGYYHYTYNDYESNRYNIRKAKDFFLKLGINTKGFVAPMGKWREELMCALEDEGYVYSSDFSYDYMGFPGYPALKEGCSGVLQIPVFPVAPELFFEQGDPGDEAVIDYYRKAIDEMMECGIPAIVYAHTSPRHPGIPHILAEITKYALDARKLSPASMTTISELWIESKNKEVPIVATDKTRIPDEKFIGKEVKLTPLQYFKNVVKSIFDLEKVTPAEELKCGRVKKMVKLFVRKIDFLKRDKNSE